MSQPSLPTTDRTRLRRKAERGRHDRETVAAILDAGLICHVGFGVEGRPWVFPTTYARVGEVVYLHGAVGNFALRTLAGGAEVCVTVTLIDGLVLVRSAFHHSMNYRSVMLFGVAQPVIDESEKREALLAIVDHMAPGRRADSRSPTPEELVSTLVVRLPITEGSAKVRTGPPIDDAGDMGLSHWAGVLPLRLVPGTPVPDPGRPGTASSVGPAASSGAGGSVRPTQPAPLPTPSYLTDWATLRAADAT